MKEFPSFFIEKLTQQYGEELTRKIVKGYQKKRVVTFRINQLKTTVEEVEKVLNESSILFQNVSWFQDAFIVFDKMEDDIRLLDIYKEGKIYLQSLSSMLPVLFLDLKDGQSLLDMAAAPGGKTTQVASLFKDKVLITACEKNKIRADRLRYNLKIQGVKKVTVLEIDAGKLDSFFSFDGILLDAPCSGSGTLDGDSIEKYFKEELIERVKKIQAQLLIKAVDILKPGCEMIYSTCSILEEENEKQIDSILKRKDIELIPLDSSCLEGVPFLPSKISGTLIVSPSDLYEGFFICKLRKKEKVIM